MSALTSYLLFDSFNKNETNLIATVMNSSLAGLVMITGVCDDVNVYFTLAIGFLSAIIYLISTRVLQDYKIDDPLDVIQVHGICGFFGILIVGIFGETDGLILTPDHSFRPLFVQFIGATSIVIFGFTTSYIYFKSLNNLGRLRVSKFYEVVGIDWVTHTMSDQIGENDDFCELSRSKEH